MDLEVRARLTVLDGLSAPLRRIAGLVDRTGIAMARAGVMGGTFAAPLAGLATPGSPRWR